MKQTLSVFLFFSRYSQKASSFNIVKVVVYGQWSTGKNTIKCYLSVFYQIQIYRLNIPKGLKKNFKKESIIYSITIDEHFADSVHDFTDAISTLFDFINNPIICDFQGQAIITPKIFNKNIFEVIFI
jgi:hypothetical protein